MVEVFSWVVRVSWWVGFGWVIVVDLVCVGLVVLLMVGRDVFGGLCVVLCVVVWVCCFIF